MKQNTIRIPISFKGIGLHSGLPVNIRIYPASVNTGIVFKRIDINGNNKIKALYNNVSSTTLGTTISTSNKIQNFLSKFFVRFGIIKEYGITIRTIEHFMASLWACDIDNVIVEIDNKETPIMDGSASQFIDEIKKAGIQPQNDDRKFLIVKKEVVVGDKNRYIKLLPSDNFEIDLTIDFKYGNIGKQSYFFDGNKKNFIEQISLARTFCNVKDVNFMRKHNLAIGGSEDNAMIFDENKILNKNGFRCDLEPVKHKLLDCVGDMFTSGYYMKCKIEALKTGHTLNNQILKKLFSDKNNYEII